jgi:hypothetical protein
MTNEEIERDTELSNQDVNHTVKSLAKVLGVKEWEAGERLARILAPTDANDLERLQTDIDHLEDKISRLEWRLGEMVVLMQSDIDGQKITASETRTNLIDECRDLLGLKGR